MPRSSFDKIAFFYDFVETYILKDYQGSAQLISDYLPQLKRSLIIDIGGGTGYFSELLSNDEVKAIVAEPSRKMLKKRKNKLPIQADGASLGIKNEIFDLAIIINVLHHMTPKSQNEVLSEVHRILKPGGQVFIIEVFFPHTFWKTLFAKIETFLVGKTYHVSPDTLKNQLNSKDFSSIDLFLPHRHSWKYVILATK